jgi:hypothetical protein
MQYFDEPSEQERCFSEAIKSLQRVNESIEQLSEQRNALIQEIIDALEHSHEGQKTYEYNEWKIEVRTPFVYSLNKKLYQSGFVNLPKEFNPIKESISYTVDKRLCEQYLRLAPQRVKEALIELIDKKPGKPGVVIKEREL